MNKQTKINEKMQYNFMKLSNEQLENPTYLHLVGITSEKIEVEEMNKITMEKERLNEIREEIELFENLH